MLLFVLVHVYVDDVSPLLPPLLLVNCRRLCLHSPRAPVPDSHAVQVATVAAVAADLRVCSVEDDKLQHHVHLRHDVNQQQVRSRLFFAFALARFRFLTRQHTAPAARPSVW
jgi:hypothetical protein